MTATAKDAAAAFLAAHPDLKFVDAFLADVNGILRGKRLRADAALKLFDRGLKLPRSLVGVDVWGTDVLTNGLVMDTGDGDGVCRPTETGLAPVPWAEQPTAQLLMMMHEADDSAFLADPRQLLVTMRDRLAGHGLAAVAAMEMEFYLFDAALDERGRPQAPASHNGGRRVLDGRMYAMDELDSYGAFFAALYDACEAQGLPIDTAIVEAGAGQFEVNLIHQNDPVRAADQAILLRRAIKGVAASQGLCASFMAKPFQDQPGDGMHVHMSMTAKDGGNAFDNGAADGSPLLRQAIAGLVASAPEAMVFFAPHLNSMRRFQEGSHAPTRAGWGYENRTAAIRVPDDDGANRRFEHRISGADANPYLVLASIIAGALHGIENKLEAPAPIEGDGYAADAPRLPNDWESAIDRFERGAILAPAFGPLFTRVFAACKKQEVATARARVTDFEYDSYLKAF